MPDVGPDVDDPIAGRDELLQHLQLALRAAEAPEADLPSVVVSPQFVLDLPRETSGDALEEVWHWSILGNEIEDTRIIQK